MQREGHLRRLATVVDDLISVCFKGDDPTQKQVDEVLVAIRRVSKPTLFSHKDDIPFLGRERSRAIEIVAKATIEILREGGNPPPEEFV